MNGQRSRFIQGAGSEHGPGFFLCLALVSILIPLPYFILAVVLFVFTIVQFRASPLPEPCLLCRFLPQPCLRSPPQ